MKTSRTRVRPGLTSTLGLSTVLLACSGGSGSGSSVTAAQAAADGANAFCARAEACAPAYVELEWGNVSTCSTRFGAQLADTLASSGTSDTPSQIEACAQALPGIACSDLLGHSIPAPCRAMPG